MKPSNQLPEFIGPLDLLIRAGRIREARDHLRLLLNSHREDAPWLAQIARRTGQYELAHQILHRWVRPPERSRHLRATDHEALEYGAALTNLYALKEAREVLGSLDGRKFPDAYFFQAMGSIAEWDHAGAIYWLELFLSQNSVEPYRRLLGQVNLALALLLARRWDDARALISKNVTEAKNNSAQLLLLNSLESRTHLEYVSGNLQRAQVALGETLKMGLDEASPLRAVLFVEKWRVLIGLRTRHSNYWLREARLLQKRARAQRDFETARAIDFHLGRDLKDPSRLTQVYYGSPFPSYRRLIEGTAKASGFEIPKTWVWQPSPRSSHGRISKRSDIDIAEVAPSHGLLLKLLTSLASDHYRPRPLMALHEELYPGIHFNPRSSRDQMHQMFKRLRACFFRRSLALGIREYRGTYCLEGQQSLILRRDESALDAQARIARSLMGHEEFASSKLAQQLNITKPTAVSRIREWLDSGVLERRGSGPATRYKFV